MPFLTAHMACQNKMNGLYPAASILEAGADRLLHLTLVPVCSGTLQRPEHMSIGCAGTASKLIVRCIVAAVERPLGQLGCITAAVEQFY